VIPTDDRGFALGDGLFETVLAREGELVLWPAHLARLARGCAVLGLPAPDAGACREAARAALDQAGLAAARAAVRLNWSAGPGGRGLDRPEPMRPRLTAQAAPAPRPAGPVAVATAAVRRNQGSPAARLKTLSYLDNVLARREARAAGADEAVMLNAAGDLACAAAGNLFWIAGGTLHTPALECGVLDGVMRGALVDRARAAGWRVVETAAPRSALDAAEAVLLTNSLIGVRAVARLDGRDLPPHPAAAELAALVSDLA